MVHFLYMEKTTFEIARMDCPSEEALVKMKLSSFGNIRNLDFDLEKRRLVIYHEGLTDQIEKALADLKLDSRRVETQSISDSPVSDARRNERKVLWTVFLINFAFFVIEGLTGIFARSMGLVADGSDMLADAIVYGLSIYAVHRTVEAKRNVARLSGYFQMALAIIGFLEVIRRFMATDNPPNYMTMITISLFALAANAICLYLLKKVSHREAHIKASMIFTSNDVIINMGVILAGSLVYLLNSNKPDLVIGAIVFVIVMRGAVRILQLSKA